MRLFRERRPQKFKQLDAPKGSLSLPGTLPDGTVPPKIWEVKEKASPTESDSAVVPVRGVERQVMNEDPLRAFFQWAQTYVDQARLEWETLYGETEESKTMHGWAVQLVRWDAESARLYRDEHQKRQDQSH